MVVLNENGYTTYPAIESVAKMKRVMKGKHCAHYSIFDYEEWLCGNPQPLYEC